MASHKHRWEVLSEHLDGHLDDELDVPHRVEYCGCGVKRTVALSDDEAYNLAVRTGRITVETVDLVARSSAGA